MIDASVPVLVQAPCGLPFENLLAHLSFCLLLFLPPHVALFTWALHELFTICMILYHGASDVRTSAVVKSMFSSGLDAELAISMEQSLSLSVRLFLSHPLTSPSIAAPTSVMPES